jgi:hypothetical protein
MMSSKKMRLTVHISLKGNRKIHVEYWWEEHNERVYYKGSSLPYDTPAWMKQGFRLLKVTTGTEITSSRLNQCDQPTQFGHLSHLGASRHQSN